MAASPKCAGATGPEPCDRARVRIARRARRRRPLTNDPPVALPGVSSATLWKLVVHERRQGSNCPPTRTLQAGACGRIVPVPRGRTGHDRVLGADPPAGCLREGRVRQDGVRPGRRRPGVGDRRGSDRHALQPARVGDLRGRGFKPTGNQATGPIVLVKQGETWALWSKVFYGFDGVLFPLESFGVDHYAGLLWPRVVGTRGGRPFRYSAKLPNLVTDRLASCFGDVTDCYYTAPWPFDVQKNVNQGNGPGAFSHNNEQQYAFDFGLVDGDEIRAARGGVVGDVVEGLKVNYNPCDPATPDADGPATTCASTIRTARTRTTCTSSPTPCRSRSARRSAAARSWGRPTTPGASAARTCTSRSRSSARASTTARPRRSAFRPGSPARDRTRWIAICR